MYIEGNGGTDMTQQYQIKPKEWESLSRVEQILLYMLIRGKVRSGIVGRTISKIAQAVLFF